MSVITWKNVDAPDFTGALRGVGLTNTLLNQAVESAGAGVDQFKKMKQDAADRAILGRMNSITDPAAYAKAQRQGLVVGPDAQNASMDMLEKAAGRGAVLVDDSAAAEDLRKGLYTNSRNEGFNAADDAFSSQYGNWQTAVKSGKLEALDALTNTQEFKDLSLPRQKELTDGFRTAIRDKVGLDSTLQGMRIRANEEGRAQAAEAKRLQEEARIKKFNAFVLEGKTNGWGPEDYRANLEARISKGYFGQEDILPVGTALAGMGIENSYSNPVAPEDAISTGNPELDATLVQQTGMVDTAFNQTVNRASEQIAKLSFIGGIPTQTYATLHKDGRPPAEVIKAVVSDKNNPLFGASEADLQARYDHDMKKYVGSGKDKISAAAYFEIMKNNLVSNKGFWNESTLTNTDDIGLSNGLEVPENVFGDSKFQIALDDAVSGNVQKRVAELDYQSGQKAAYEKAKQEATAAATQLAKSLRLARTNPKAAGAAQRDKEAYARAMKKFEALTTKMNE